MKRTSGVAVLVCVLAVSLVTAACGAAPSQDVNAGFQASTYSNEGFGFSVDYPSGFVKAEIPRNAQDPKAPLLDVIFADPEGTQIDGKSVDTLEVAVYGMSAAPSKADIKKHHGDFEAMLAMLVGDLPGLTIAEPLTWTTVDGRTAVTQTYTYTISGQDVAACAQLAFEGDKAYLLRAQAGREAWKSTGRELVSCMATFAFR